MSRGLGLVFIKRALLVFFQAIAAVQLIDPGRQKVTQSDHYRSLEKAELS